MARLTNNPGYIDTQDYRSDPDTEVVPDRRHHEYDQGMDSSIIAQQSDFAALSPNIPTSDQKAALDGNPGLDAGNPVASQSDIASAVAAAYALYTFRTATDAPADGEVKLDNAVPAAATLVRIANINSNGSNIGNVLLKLGQNDAILLQSNTTGGDLYNYDITGDPVQVGGAGSGGYVELPVAAFDITGTLSDAESTIALFLFDGNNTRFLAKTNNLSDLDNFVTARTNLDVYSTAEALASANDLSDLNDNATARGNLGVYSTTQADANFLAKASNLSDVANATTSRSNLGAQAQATALDDIAALTLVEGDILVVDGSGNIQKLAKGTSGDVLTAGASTVSYQTPASGGLPAASDAEMEAATSNVVAATPGRFKRSPFAVKAWAYVSSGGSLNASENVTSITKNGTGDYTVNLTDTMSSSDYCVLATVEEASTIQRAAVVHSLTTTSFDVTTGNPGTATLSDEPFFVAILGDI